MTDKIEEELKSLAEELYIQGYESGLGQFGDADQWLLAYAKAFKRIAAGEPYSDGMVSAIYKGIDAERETS